MGTGNTERSVLAQLRVQRWGYKHGDAEAANELAERQASLLLALTGNDTHTVDQAIRTLPRITVLSAAIPTSGLCLWDGRQWVITLNRREPRSRQRFTLLHEYKHIVDHPSVEWLYCDRPGDSSVDQAERTADYFAGCVIVPRHLLLAVWSAGMQEPKALARYFDVSVRTIVTRLRQVGLTESPTDREPPDTETDPSPNGPTALAPNPEGMAA